MSTHLKCPGCGGPTTNGPNSTAAEVCANCAWVGAVIKCQCGRHAKATWEWGEADGAIVDRLPSGGSHTHTPEFCKPYEVRR